MPWSAWAVAVLLAVVIERAVQIVVDALTIRSARVAPPPRLADLYPAETFARSQSHARESARLDMVESALEMVAIVAFLVLGGLGWLDGWVREAGDVLGLGSPWTGVAFIAILALLEVGFSLPFVLWRTFVLEARFGMNRTTPRTFVMDSVKALALAAVLGGPLLAMVIVFFERAGSSGWWLSWLLLTVVSLAAQAIVPTFVLPLFLRFDPLPSGDLRTAIETWAHGAKVQLSGLFVVDGSRRSARSNAFVTGLGGATRIALFDTLIARLRPAEVVAVLAHEVGHRRLGHITKGLVVGIAQTGVLLFLFDQILSQARLFQAFDVAPSVFAGLALFGLLFRPAELVLGALGGWLSRRFEYEADAFAAHSVGRSAMVSALESLGRDNLTNLTPHPVAVALSFSHPPLDRRIAALEH